MDTDTSGSWVGGLTVVDHKYRPVDWIAFSYNLVPSPYSAQALATCSVQTDQKLNTEALIFPDNSALRSHGS